MAEAQEQRSKVSRWSGQRALSTPTAAVIMIIVIVVVGAGGYFAFNKSTPAATSSTQKITQCAPPTSPKCTGVNQIHDVTLLIPFSAAQTGTVVPATAAVPSTDGTPSSYSFNFGDGSAVVTQAGSTANHVYTAPGTFIVTATASIGSSTHDNYQALSLVSVTASFTSSTASDVPGVTGAILSNSTSSSGPHAILKPGQAVTVSGSYSSAPTNPDFIEQAPTITAASGGAISGASGTPTSAQATVTFASSGTYWVSFVGTAKSSTTSATLSQWYNWTVFVAPTGVNAGSKGGGTAVTQHKGSIIDYELVPGGSTSEDPAVDYETAGFEVIINVYQTLIAYNGSSTGPTAASYIPEVAACVPGSTTGANNCMSLFSSSLVSADGNNYTFVISGAPQFYDPATKASWGVWPTDVLFSVARTMGFAVLPCFSCNNGWILTQALLSSGNGGWDGGIHGARNNTPSNVYASTVVNESGSCPSAAMSAPYHGCITFHANGNGVSWPYFLELISDPLGGAVVPCGWFSASAQGAGIPYWTAGNSSGAGDHPCGAPGSTGWGVSAPPATGWDAWEKAGSSPPFVGNVQWNMVGSNVYYLSSITIGAAYSLAANPAYASNPLCTWTGCEPSPGHFAKSVAVTWETSQIQGEVAYQNGVADFASIPSPDTGLRLQLIQQGKIGTITFPSISIDFMPFNFAFNVAAAEKYTTNPITVPSDVMSYSGLRQFIVHAYPYATIQQTINTKDGIQFDFNYGGAIPQFMANYYPTNVSWATGNPDSNPADVGGAAWWWAQVYSTPASPYYDPELTGCTASAPCQFPLFGQTGAPDLDQRINLWAAEISSLSGGALRANPLDINFIDAVLNSLYSGPYQNAMPLFRLGWAPDYPDPTDYAVPLYYPDASYTASDSVLEQTQLSQFNASSCATTYAPWSAYTWWSNYASMHGGIPTACQGTAYSAMIYAMHLAAVMPAGPQRVLTYNEVEQIGNAMALYAYTFQANVVHGYAAWIDPSTINTNVTWGGGGDEAFYSLAGNGVWG